MTVEKGAVEMKTIGINPPEIHIGPEPIHFGLLTSLTPSTSCGAQITFVGAVRAENHGKKVLAVAYDAYEPLAVSALREIAHEAQSRWGGQIGVLIVHRTGKLKVGEASVLIMTQAPHRDEAYQSSRYIIEELKKRVPIWKKEYYENGETEWLKGHALCSHHESDESGFSHGDHRGHPGGRDVQADGKR